MPVSNLLQLIWGQHTIRQSQRQAVICNAGTSSADRDELIVTPSFLYAVQACTTQQHCAS